MPGAKRTNPLLHRILEPPTCQNLSQSLHHSLTSPLDEGTDTFRESHHRSIEGGFVTSAGHRPPSVDVSGLSLRVSSKDSSGSSSSIRRRQSQPQHSRISNTQFLSSLEGNFHCKGHVVVSVVGLGVGFRAAWNTARASGWSYIRLGGDPSRWPSCDIMVIV